MKIFLGVCFLSLQVVLCLPLHAGRVEAQTVGSAAAESTPILPWKSPKVEHAYGLPEVKPNQKGSLAINSGGLTFTAQSGTYNIMRPQLMTISTSNERVELWGIKGRLLRMAIPDGGGIAAAGVMHHKVNTLSVEFKDRKGGYHAALFYVPAEQAERVIASFADLPTVGPENPTPMSDAASLTVPIWNQTEVPAAYKALVYEHAIERLQRVKGIGHVYRDGESLGDKNCPEYTIRISVSAFRQGSQVKRAVIGPIGMFVGTTQMAFNVSITDVTGRLNTTEQLKATVRGESESKNVADSVAKTIAKRYATETTKFQQAGVTTASFSPQH
jgi:hypothetical protein